MSGCKALLLAFLPVAVVSATAGAQVIDFETLPGGASTVDQQSISNEYAVYGLSFSLLDPTTGDSIGVPRIAKVGAPATAFEGCEDGDTPWPYLGLGASFLTDGTMVALEGNLRVDYATPVAQASGVILDIDCRTNGGPPCEQWTITERWQRPEPQDDPGAVSGRSRPQQRGHDANAAALEP